MKRKQEVAPPRRVVDESNPDHGEPKRKRAREEEEGIDNNSAIFTLPPELIQSCVIVNAGLKPAEVLALSLTCKTLCDIVQDPL